MPRSDDALERLRAMVEELAAADAAELLAEARIEARARVRASLTDALAHSMLERLHDQLPAPQPPARDVAPPRPARDFAQRSGVGGQRAWYVYGVVNAETELHGRVDGVDPSQPLTMLTEDPLAAVASQVPLHEFDEARLREHLADMAWVEATARAHEAVLDSIRAQTTVVPMRMCTVYRTEGGVREMLRRESDPLQEAIGHLSGKAEWGVKAFVELGRRGEPDSAQGPDADNPIGAAPGAGAAYMERKRAERERRERAMELAEEAAAQIHERLSAVTDDALVVPLQRPEASGHSGEMILNGVYLVADEVSESFHQEVRALQAELGPAGLELEPTGPWPAYNFVPGTIGAAW
jgi:Gas vesicle synthesis protein GvpL/GvpF